MLNRKNNSISNSVCNCPFGTESLAAKCNYLDELDKF